MLMFLILDPLMDFELKGIPPGTCIVNLVATSSTILTFSIASCFSVIQDREPYPYG